MRLILGPFWVGAGISILEYYDIVGENIRNRSPNNSNRPHLAKNWRKQHWPASVESNRPCLAQKPMGRIFVKKKGAEAPKNPLQLF